MSRRADWPTLRAGRPRTAARPAGRARRHRCAAQCAAGCRAGVRAGPHSHARGRPGVAHCPRWRWGQHCRAAEARLEARHAGGQGQEDCGAREHQGLLGWVRAPLRTMRVQTPTLVPALCKDWRVRVAFTSVRCASM